jgi:hypothetical protein
MVKETREEEQRDIFIENTLHTVEILRQKNFENFYENYVTKSKPIIISGIVSKWPAYRKWTDVYLGLMSKSGSFTVQNNRHNVFSRHFGAPYSVTEYSTMEDFLKNYRSAKRTTNFILKGPLSPLEVNNDIPLDLPFSEGMFKTAINIIIASGGQISNLGTTNQETFLVQLVGWRKYMLFDPLQTTDLYPKRESPLESHIDMTNPNLNDFPNFGNAKAVTGKLNPGEILYIPANWWYFEVIQEGRNVALEYTYTTHNLPFSKMMDAMRSSLKDELESINNKQA